MLGEARQFPVAVHTELLALDVLFVLLDTYEQGRRLQQLSDKSRESESGRQVRVEKCEMCQWCNGNQDVKMRNVPMVQQMET